MKGDFINYSFGDLPIRLYTPDTNELKNAWNSGSLTHFPYWGKCWPAALGLAEFITQYPSLIRDKEVVELAAGLGLPSMVAALYAKKVISSDYLPDPLAYINKSAKENSILNIETCIINWQQLPTDLHADVVLLSDVNYDPDAFNALDQLLSFFLKQGTLIILSTPQRIMAKSFVEKWQSFQVLQEEFVYDEVRVSVWVLKSVLPSSG